MEVQVGELVLAPHPDGEGVIQAEVAAFGEPGDAVEMMVEGKPILRDVAILVYQEGDYDGLIGKARYDLLKPIPD